MDNFVELCATSNFSFLRGAAHPEELVAQAKLLGLAGLGIADRNSFAGIVRAHVAAKEAGLRLVVGTRLVFADGTPDILAYPQDRAAYGRLTRLLTLGNRRAAKGACHLQLTDFLDHAEGQQAIVAPGMVTDATLRACLTAIRARSGQVWLAARWTFDGEDRRRLRQLKLLAAETGARLIATTEPLHHVPARRALLDVLTCIREKTTLDAAGRLLAANAERHIKPASEMQRLYAQAPQAVSQTVHFAAAARFSLDDLSYQYPDETVAGHATAQDALVALAWQGAARRYPNGVPDSVGATLERELAIIAQLGYAAYFLTVADIVRFARDERGILCQGRGSAANSSICYCLGITEVNPATAQLLFERFVSAERAEPPDIDVDFEHERREEVIQYVYAKYGRHRAALTAALICYRGRSAVRDVCKAFGYSEDRIASLAKTFHWWASDATDEELRAQGFDPDDTRLRTCLGLVEELRGFPRHLSQHVGGLVITRDRLDEVVPIQNAAMADRTIVEWDKSDLDSLKILKVDLLALGMLTCLHKAFRLINTHYPNWSAGNEKLTLASLPKEDPAVYRMLTRADSVGVFQVESRAQMSMLPRLRPERFYDLVIEVAIVRPGPIQGGMVHPYLRRKQGLDAITYPSEALRQVLERTLGVPLFQEQAMQIAIVAAGFTPAEADKLRRAMATFRRLGTITALRDKFIGGMIARGYTPDFAEASFRQIEGFGEYGFPESHAASFALLVYASSWVKCHYPDVFAAALLNAQPMGFYAPSQLVRDAEEHGVAVLPPDVNHSAWDNTLAPGPATAPPLHTRHADMHGDIHATHALRLGLRQITGVREADMARLTAARGPGYDSVHDVWLRTGLAPGALELLADADAFGSLGLARRDALWAVRGLNRVGDNEDLPLFTPRPGGAREAGFALPPMLLGEHIVEDYRVLGLSLKAHPVGLLRDVLRARKILPASQLGETTPGKRVRVAGLVLVRQRPGTASGVIFMTLEDETHIANIVVWPRVFEGFRAEVLGARLCAVEGIVQQESGVVHVIAERLWDYAPLLAHLSSAAWKETLSPADEVRRQTADTRSHPRTVRHDLSDTGAEQVMPRGRNFH